MVNPKYPLGQQSFKSIREDGAIYVDKTQFIPLILNNQFFFLSRPRRFGKSLFLSTLEHFFRGDRYLFKGLAIDSFDWDWKQFPTIRLDFTGENYHDTNALLQRLSSALNKYETEFQIPPLLDSTLPERFRSLIVSAHKKFDNRVVILVDEYEKALLDVIGNPELLQIYRNILSGFYSVLKAEAEHIKLVFLTGITRFGHINIFSGLNNISDISLDEDFSSICGITQEELLDNFQTGISLLAQEKELDYDQTVALLKNHYDGYHFSRKLLDVYNPYSLMSSLYSKSLKSEWFFSGSSSYLLEILKNQDFNLFDLEGYKASAYSLLGVDARMLDPIPLLYQSGYLTIKDYDKRSERYTLGIPNAEVKNALYDAIVPFYLGANHRLSSNDKYNLAEMIRNGDPEGIVRWLTSFLSKIPYQTNLMPLGDHLRFESDFQFIIYAIFALACGLDNIELEYSVAGGRIDLLIKAPQYIYIFEFKLDGSADEAISQIADRHYPDAWAAEPRTLFRIGIVFSSKTRSIISSSIL